MVWSNGQAVLPVLLADRNHYAGPLRYPAQGRHRSRIGMAGTDYNLFDKWTEQVDSLIDESLTIGSKQCLVAAKSTAAPSCEDSTI